MMKRHLFIFLSIFIFFLAPHATKAAGVDIGFTGGTQDIFFSKERLIMGEPVRIYARVHNFRDEDVTAQVVFYHGAALIDEPKPVSIRARGLSDEVYVDWTVPDGSFNIRVEVRGQIPRDENPANDSALTALVTPEKPLPPPPPSPPPANPGGTFSPSSGGYIAPGLATSVGSERGNGAAVKKGSDSKSKEPKVLGAHEGAVKPTIALAPPAPSSRVAGEATALSVENGTSAQAPEIAMDSLLKVSIEVQQIAWNTFRFIADTNRANGVSYEWSFGDGKAGQGKEVTHAFTFAGRYIISAVAIAENGERAQEKITLDISFWHLGNWQLWIILLLLIGFVLLLLLTTRGEKREKVQSERSAVEEGETPPVLLAEEEREKEAAQAPSVVANPVRSRPAEGSATSTSGRSASNGAKKKRKSPPRKKKKPSPPPEEEPTEEPPTPEVTDDETSE